MTLLIVIAVLLVLALPLVPAIREWRRGKDATPLSISSAYAADRHLVARRFGEEVRATLSEAIANYTSKGGGPRGASPIAESFDVYSGADVAAGLSADGRPAIILSFEPEPLPVGLVSDRPAYIAGSIQTGSESRFRALYADGAIQLGGQSEIIDWVHADGRLSADAGCSLRGSASSGESIEIYPGCCFERLHAPEIRFGDEWHWSGTWEPSLGEDVQRPVLRLVHRSERLGDGKVISGNLSIPAGHAVEGDLVVRGNLRVGRGATVLGSIKARGTVKMDSGSRVNGSVFANGDIRIGRDARIGGVLSSEANVHLLCGVVIGTLDGLTTVSGRTLLIDQGVRIHGIVLATASGLVASRTSARQVA